MPLAIAAHDADAARRRRITAAYEVKTRLSLSGLTVPAPSAAEISASQHSLRPSFTAVNQRFSFLAIRDTRDYFAGQAIVGMLSNPHCTLPVTQRDCFPAHTLQILAFHAYQIADALIEASVIKLSSIPPEP